MNNECTRLSNVWCNKGKEHLKNREYTKFGKKVIKAIAAVVRADINGQTLWRLSEFLQEMRSKRGA